MKLKELKEQNEKELNQTDADMPAYLYILLTC